MLELGMDDDMRSDARASEDYKPVAQMSGIQCRGSSRR
jgi:hypothetical protein